MASTASRVLPIPPGPVRGYEAEVAIEQSAQFLKLVLAFDERSSWSRGLDHWRCFVVSRMNKRPPPMCASDGAQFILIYGRATREARYTQCERPETSNLVGNIRPERRVPVSVPADNHQAGLGSEQDIVQCP
jgi:hypothetical protein